jgi:hypothetical protein
MEPPRSLTACSFLPPGGAAAPTVWQSQSRGPGLKESPVASVLNERRGHSSA